MVSQKHFKIGCGRYEIEVRGETGEAQAALEAKGWRVKAAVEGLAKATG